MKILDKYFPIKYKIRLNQIGWTGLYKVEVSVYRFFPIYYPVHKFYEINGEVFWDTITDNRERMEKFVRENLLTKTDYDNFKTVEMAKAIKYFSKNPENIYF